VPEHRAHRERGVVWTDRDADRVAQPPERDGYHHALTLMASSSATTVSQYLAELPEDRRKVISKVRRVIKKHLPRGYKEGMQFGMITYYVPLDVFPDTYNKQPLLYAGLAAQKNNYAVYLQAVYGDPAIEAWWRQAFAASGKRLDMGKSCVRFRSLEALPLDVLGACIAKVSLDQYLARYEAVKGSARLARRAPSGPTVKKARAGSKGG
jgi:hypothetical protein